MPDVDLKTKYKNDIDFYFPSRNIVESTDNDISILTWQEQAANVTAVADNGSGFARFTFTAVSGQVILAGQTIQNSLFADGAYNILSTVSVTDGTTFYDLADDPVFTATDTGLMQQTVTTVENGNLGEAYKILREQQLGFIVDELMLPKDDLGGGIVFVDVAEDLEILAVSNVITIDEDTKFVFRTSITSATRFEITSNSQLIFEGQNNPNWGYAYTGTGTFISGQGGFRSDGMGFINFPGTQIFIDMDHGRSPSNSSNLRNGFLVGFSDYGTFLRGGVAFTDFSSLFMTTGFTIDNANFIGNQIGGQFTIATGPFLTFTGPGEADIIEMSNLLGDLGAEPFLNIDAALHPDSRVAIIGGTIDGAAFFETADGTTGTFSAVADAAVAATAITSVSGNPGIGDATTFNFTPGPTMFPGQTVVISGFVSETSYNGTFYIDAVAAGSFTIEEIPFTATDTGSFLSNSVTVTETTTTLVDLDTIVLDTTDATDYDGGFTVYNQLVNSFEISATFTATQAGTWNSSGINQSDPRVLTVGISNFEESHKIGAGFVNNNATATPSITNNVFQDCEFGTLTEATTIERFKLIDTQIGEFEYTGNEHFHGSITFDFTSTSSGGSTDFRYKWVIDTGGGYGDLPDAVEIAVAIGGSLKSTTQTFPVEMDKGDRIKPQITRNSGASGITTMYSTIYITT